MIVPDTQRYTTPSVSAPMVVVDIIRDAIRFVTDN
jgi:hypothetical protein